jgi:hypothetical protein
MIGNADDVPGRSRQAIESKVEKTLVRSGWRLGMERALGLSLGGE